MTSTMTPCSACMQTGYIDSMKSTARADDLCRVCLGNGWVMVTKPPPPAPSPHHPDLGAPWRNKEPEPEPVTKTTLDLAEERMIREIEDDINAWTRGSITRRTCVRRIRNTVRRYDHPRSR